MKKPIVQLILLLTVALLFQEASAMNQWLKNYLTGMDQLMMLAWRNIYFYTWLIFPKWLICGYFWDLGTKLYPNAIIIEG